MKKPFALNVLISNGRIFMAYRQGHGLHYRFESDPCARLMVCSEPLSHEAGFTEIKDGQMIGMDASLRFFTDI